MFIHVSVLNTNRGSRILQPEHNIYITGEYVHITCQYDVNIAHETDVSQLVITIQVCGVLGICCFMSVHVSLQHIAPWSIQV